MLRLIGHKADGWLPSLSSMQPGEFQATPVSCLYGNSKFLPSDINTYEYDLEKAKALLKEGNIDAASLGEIVMDTYYNDQLSLGAMTAFQQDLDAVGIKTKIQRMDVPSCSKRYYNDNASEMSFIGGANGPDPNRTYAYFYSTALWPNGWRSTSRPVE
jgi:ABC-type transport system substrate-binding protein